MPPITADISDQPETGSPPPPVQDGAAWIDSEKNARLGDRRSIRIREWIWSWLRLAGFALIVFAFVSLAGHGQWRVAGTAGAMAVFGWCVRCHNKVRSTREALDRLLLMLEESQKRCGGRVVLIRSHERPTGGVEQGTADTRLDGPHSGPYWKLTDQELDDLDLYAPPVGIFGLLNRNSTIYGARRLSFALEHPCLDIDCIKSRQDAIRWLEEHPQDRLSLMAAAAVLRDQDKWLDQLEAAINDAQPLGQNALRLFMRCWSIASTIFIVYALMRGMSGSTSWAINAIAMIFWNAALFQSLRKNLAKWLEPWREVSRQANGMLLIARESTDRLPKDGLLCGLRQMFASVSDHRVLPALCRWLPFAETGGPMHAFFNHVIFYDLHVAERIAAHALPNREHLRNMFEALGNIEAACCVASFAWEQPIRCYPQLQRSHEIEILDGAHPLIEPHRVVSNSLDLDGELRTWIITGSNMAGKSTYLRMVGINVLFAQMGGPCTARSVRLRPLRLISDLRARDNLAREESYFLAEVRQLRRMVMTDASPQAGENTPVLGLIDEPFRGTNSQERLAASLAVVEHLMASGGYFLIATHEASLTGLADEKRARNLHFQEKFEQGAAVFDYALRDGPATTRNALRVLEREGYPAELMKRARAWMAENESANG